MHIDKNHKALIESVIKENSRYKGNEQLLNIILEAVYKKSYLLLDAMKDTNRLKRHLEDITTTCIEQVLAEKQKFEGIRIVKRPKPEPPITKQEPVQKKEFSKEKLKEQFQLFEPEDLSSIDDPRDYYPNETFVVSKLEAFIDYIKEIDKCYKTKKYYDIFYSRYIKKQDQIQIAQELGISQVELSKRFVELVNLIKDRYKH